MIGFRQYILGNRFLAIGLAIIAGVVFLAWPGTRIAWGQLVTYPNPNYQTQAGRVDNSASSYRPINTQLYITGQVTGLRSFRGEVGYRAPNELRTNVPSAGLRKFLRQSVGLPDVIAGQTYLPQPYFDRSLTAWPAGGILAGRTAAGTGTPRTSRGTPAPSAQVQFGAKPQYYDPAGIYSQAFPLVARPQLPSVSPLKTRPPIIPSETIAELARLVVEAPIDVTLVRQPYELVKPSEQAKLAAELAKLVPSKFEVDARIETRLKSEIDADVEATPEVLKPPPEPKQLEIDPEFGQDAFVELLKKLKARQEKDAPGVPGKQTEPDSPPRRDPLDEPTLEQGQFQQLPPIERKKSKRGLIEFAPGGDVVILSFAGSHEDWFNVNLNKAAQHLSQGLYYQASRRYKLAVTLNPANPMARLGLCLSLFAAGESRVAGLSLYRAMALFPPIGETRLDIPQMMDEMVFARRLDLLEYQIQRAGSDVPALAYLTAVFMYRSAGQDFQAQAYAHKLIESADGNELLTGYAKFVLTGQRQPSSVPANQ